MASDQPQDSGAKVPEGCTEFVIRFRKVDGMVSIGQAGDKLSKLQTMKLFLSMAGTVMNEIEETDVQERAKSRIIH